MATPWFLNVVLSVKSLCILDIGSLLDRWSNVALAKPKLPSAFSNCIGLILCGIVDEPTSPGIFFCFNIPLLTYDQISLHISIKMLFTLMIEWKLSTTESCGSICVVTRFGLSPKDETKFLVNCIQFTFGCEIECAAHVPVAPPNFPRRV